MSQLDFELEAVNDEPSGSEDIVEPANVLVLKNADRLHKKRVSNYNKMKRMSLFASAINSDGNLPGRQSICIETIAEVDENTGAAELCSQSEKVVTTILSFFNESELMTKAFPVCKAWSDYATLTYTKLLISSIKGSNLATLKRSGTAPEKQLALEISWKAMHCRFPWACFLAEGGAKKVHKVYNFDVKAEEALSVMYDL